MLTAEPADISGKRRLVVELKTRAKSSIKTKNYIEAVTLYDKALAVLPDEDREDNAILHANISMCKSAISRYVEALDNAEKSIELNPNYCKGFYRKAIALIGLAKYANAKETLLLGLKLQSDDKDLLLQLNNVEVLLSKPETTKQIKKSEATSISTTSNATKTSSSSSSTTSTSLDPNKITISTKDAALEDEVEGVIRGYKTTSDGRKTTFFNHEMDEETKKLIGDIAPKKIDDKSIVVEANSVGSAWNTAGTFESVNYTPFAKARIEQLLVGLCYDYIVDEKQCSIMVKGVEVTGDAEIACLRGKRKHIYDFTVIVQWTCNDGAVDGSIEVSDVTADQEYEYRTPTIASSVVSTQLHVSKQLKLFQQKVTEVLNAFAVEFKLK